MMIQVIEKTLNQRMTMNFWYHESESLHREGEYFCKLRYLNISPKEVSFSNV